MSTELGQQNVYSMYDHEDLFEDSPCYQILKPRHDPADNKLKPFSEFQRVYSESNGHAPGTAKQVWDSSKERNPPLMETMYRLGHGRQINLDDELKRREPRHFVESNSTRCTNDAFCFGSWMCLPLLGPCIYSYCVKQFEVPMGYVLPLEDGEGEYLLAGQGVHRHCAPFWSVHREPHCYSEGALTHGDWCLVVVDQGFIGLAFDKGQPVLLPPGFHQWKSKTLKFHKVIDMNEPVIYLGPYTLLTVDEGYAAVTQDNGKQDIKCGGTVHLLTHRNHKFEKFLTTKIQTDSLARIEVITGDNVLMLTDATVNWRIADVHLAARFAAETMKEQGSSLGNIAKLRNDVLQQASASLSSFIGTVNYSDTFAAPALIQKGTDPGADAPVMGAVVEPASQGGVLFDTARMVTAVGHANTVTKQYGVEIVSINIISAKPADAQLMQSLAQGAVAAAEAQQLETTAVGQAKALQIQADTDAKASLITAQAAGDVIEIEAQAAADAEVQRAQGAKKAADQLATSRIAVDLARIERTGAALSGTSLFFGADPSQVGSVLSNPGIVKVKAASEGN